MHRCFIEPAWIAAWLKDKKHALPTQVSRRFIEIVRIKPTEEEWVFLMAKAVKSLVF